MGTVIKLPTASDKEIKQKEYEDALLRRVGVSPNLLKPLRDYYLWGMTASAAARKYEYSPRYIMNVTCRLRKLGHDEVLQAGLKPYEEKDLEEAFWTAMKSLIKQGNPKAMELYAKITGKIKVGDGGGKFQLNQQFNIAEADKLLEDI